MVLVAVLSVLKVATPCLFLLPSQGEEDSGSKVTPQEAEIILREKFDEESHWLTEVQAGEKNERILHYLYQGQMNFSPL